jgi:NADH-quinone oxidoreductase subunit M
MVNVHLGLLASAILSPAAFAVMSMRQPSARRSAIAASTISLATLIGAVVVGTSTMAPMSLDNLASAPAIAFAAIMLAAFIAAPKTDVTGRQCALTLCSVAGTLIVYCAGDPWLSFTGFAIATAPVIVASSRLKGGSSRAHTQPALVLCASLVLLAAGVALMPTASGNPSLQACAFVLITTSALMRSGVFPFHSWLITACERSATLPLIALISGQLGVVVITRLALPAFPDPGDLALPVLSDLALVGTLFTAFVALGERAPRRIVALISASQTGFIISGLQTRNQTGITGALLHWLVVAVTTAGLLMILRSVEVRFGDLPAQQFAGVGVRVPRLSAFFMIFGLALIGLPGTLGFCAEDLLFHGALEAHPYLGLALPLATALSAIQLLRLFSSIFWGRDVRSVPAVSDALWRERWAFTAAILFLIATGLVPRPFVRSRSAAAHTLISVVVPPPVQRTKIALARPSHP